MAISGKFDKRLILDRIISGLELAKQAAMSAAKQAHETATHSETVAKSKYETFGLEASYLAHGQAQRVAECNIELLAYKSLNLACFSDDIIIDLSALVTIEDEQGAVKTCFIGPGAGGMKIDIKLDTDIDTGAIKHGDPKLGHIIVITPSSPLGQILMGKLVYDSVQLTIGGALKHYEIISVS
ncbi:GreA/GreB family elongation factor [Shewanella violacea]|uniref:Transcription elongation factor GreA/GreB C-terminal domain-containing protein n=1 Tax=Shewanella violacea (strain JCM 10179 / CIP 106290 / LMG 19151 / DSS12) TaxID=637905 RepID=D4ZJR8_SHEVD|nr:hypothetical protein [Shewanella violacea]BAJ01917.1 conserved hypothetical protein [Shewanella violacea DSS12]